MTVHENARLTPRGRERIVDMAVNGQTPKAIAQAVEVCPGRPANGSVATKLKALLGCRSAARGPSALPANAAAGHRTHRGPSASTTVRQGDCVAGPVRSVRLDNVCQAR